MACNGWKPCCPSGRRCWWTPWSKTPAPCVAWPWQTLPPSAGSPAERTQALTGINSLSLEVLDLSFNALALGQEPPAYNATCPFQGLLAFDSPRRSYFFGRTIPPTCYERSRRATISWPCWDLPAPANLHLLWLG